MANTAAKKLKQANEQFLFSILIGILVVNVLYLVLNLPSMLMWDTFTFWNYVGWGFAFLASMGCYVMLRMSAKCRYEGNTLVSAGEDLRGGGLLSYVFDLFCVIAFVQLLSCLTNYAWYLLLIVPAYAVIKLWTSLISPMIFGGSGMPMPEMDEKTRKKLERKQNRVRYR